MQPWRVSLTTGSHLHQHGFHLKSWVAFKDHHWPRQTTRGLGPSSSGQVRNCTFFMKKHHQSVQISWGTGQLHVSVVIDTNVKLGTQRWGGEVWNELGWVTRWGGEWASLTRFSAHILAHSHVRSSFRGNSTFKANVSLLWWLLACRCCLECSCHEGNSSSGGILGFSARRDVQMWDGGEAGQRLQGERKRRRHRRVTLG